MTRAQIIKHASGGEQLRLNGHSYSHRDTKSGRVYWRCILWRGGQCTATAITQRAYDGGVDVLKEGIHQHDPLEISENESDFDDEDNVSDDQSVDDDDDSDSDDQSVKHECRAWESWEEGSDLEEEMYDEEETDDEESPSVSDGEYDSDLEREDAIEMAYGLLKEKVKLHKSALRNLKDINTDVREAIFRSADKSLICFLCEICWNTLVGYFDLKRNERHVLKIFRDEIRALADEETTWQAKKNTLEEYATNPFLPVMLNILEPYMPT